MGVSLPPALRSADPIPTLVIDDQLNTSQADPMTSGGTNSSKHRKMTNRHSSPLNGKFRREIPKLFEKRIHETTNIETLSLDLNPISKTLRFVVLTSFLP
jgi:hypothetical protein